MMHDFRPPLAVRGHPMKVTRIIAPNYSKGLSSLYT